MKKAQTAVMYRYVKYQLNKKVKNKGSGGDSKQGISKN
jgi:hypothetical protein